MNMKTKQFSDFQLQAQQILAEAKRKYAALDGWVMQLEGDESDSPADSAPAEDLTGLKDTLSKVRNERKEEEKRRKELERQLQQLQAKFKDVDPDAYAQLQAEAQKAQEAEAAAARLRGELESDFERRLAAVNQEKETALQELANFRRRIEIEKAFVSSQGRNDGVDGETYFDSFFAAYGNRFKQADDGTYYVEVAGKRQYNNEGKLMTPAEYMATLRKNPVAAVFFQPEQKSGSGMSPMQSNRPGMQQVDTSKMSATQKIALGLSGQ